MPFKDIRAEDAGRRLKERLANQANPQPQKAAGRCPRATCRGAVFVDEEPIPYSLMDTPTQGPVQMRAAGFYCEKCGMKLKFIPTHLRL